MTFFISMDNQCFVFFTHHMLKYEFYFFILPNVILKTVSVVKDLTGSLVPVRFIITR